MTRRPDDPPCLVRDLLGGVDPSAAAAPADEDVDEALGFRMP